MLVPRLKMQNTNGEIAVFPKILTVNVDKKLEEKALKLLSLFLPQCETKTNRNAIITAIETKEYINEPEKYQIKISFGGIMIFYSDYIGLRNAFSTLSMLATSVKDGFSFPLCDIEDGPIALHRGVLLDLARGVKDFNILKDHIVLIGKAKMNVLHLHLNDSIGVCFEMECMPESYRMDGAYTKAQMLEIKDLAEVLGLEIVPEFDIPGHATKLIKAMPELCCDVEGKSVEDMSNWAVCAGTEQVYKIFEEAIKEVIEMFPGRYFHIGGDELEFPDVPELNALCYWSECSKCKALREKEGLKDRQELYYYFVNRIYGIVKSCGRQMIMWSDQIDCMRPAVLPKDIIMQFWRVASEGRGPIEGCSMNAQLKMGYTVINSYYPETYFDLEEYMSSKTLLDWHWQKRPVCDTELTKNIIGSELSAWEYGNIKDYPHYELSLPSAVFLFADKLWNGMDLEYTEEYSKALTKAILGADMPENLDVFACIGDILPPRKKDEKIYKDKITVGKDFIDATVAELKKLIDNGNKTAAVYMDAICS